MFSFEVTHTDGPARCGVYHTPHGDVATPAFMPVGTVGTVKGVTPTQLAKTGATMILANTYHLQLRPSADAVAALGGLHRFMGWDGPILTDSGGYQVFSLGKINRVTDEGVEFRSHVDGAAFHLGPKSATEMQNKLGADVIMAFDECVRLPAEAAALTAVVDRTIRWAGVCKDTHARSDQALFGIVQGGLDIGLRRRCAEALMSIGFDGYAVGGLSVGESHEDMVTTLADTVSDLPADRPRYLMGVGTPRDLLAAIRTGVDLFDCVMPTRHGRNSQAFTAGGVLRMRNERHRLDGAPLEDGCDCEACRSFSRGYIRHLFNAGEMLAPTLTSIHNLRFYQRFMQRVRELIRACALARIPEEFPIASRAGVAGEKEEY